MVRRGPRRAARVGVALAVGLVALASSAHARTRRTARPPFARVAWSAAVPGARLGLVTTDATGDIVLVGERGIVERWRTADGTVGAWAQEPDCYLQDGLRAGDAMIVACLGGTGGAPTHTLVAVDLRTSHVAWRVRLGDAILWPRAVIDARTVIAVEHTRHGAADDRLRIVAIDVASGRVVFRGDGRLRATPCAMREDIHATRDLVVVSACRSGVAAFSRADGAFRWNVDAPDLRSVIPSGDRLVAWTQTGRVDAIDLRTGARRALLAETDAHAQSQPLVVTPAGDVLVQRWGRALVSIRAENGETRWTSPIAYGAAAWLRGDALVVSGNDGVVVLDVSTGTERARLSRLTASHVVVADDRVLALEVDRSDGEQGDVVVRSMRLDGSARWTSRADIAPSSPLTLGARAFVCSDAGEIYALDRDTGVAAWRAAVGRNPSTGAPCEILATAAGVLARRGDAIAFIENAPETFAPRSVRVVGRVLGDVPAAGVRVWVGHRIVRVDVRRRFDARVAAAGFVVVRIEPRDAAARCASAEPVTVPIVRGRVARARIRLERDHCVCQACD